MFPNMAEDVLPTGAGRNEKNRKSLDPDSAGRVIGFLKGGDDGYADYASEVGRKAAVLTLFTKFFLKKQWTCHEFTTLNFLDD